MKVISILNIKGGCAKTFTSANMAYELWRRNQKVLMLDNDKQEKTGQDGIRDCWEKTEDFIPVTITAS